MKRALITGVNGQLGHDLVNECRKRGIEPFGVDVEVMDITDKDAVRRVISRANADMVFHCAAWTAVDKAEEPELQETVEAINAKGPGYIAEVCREFDLPLMYFSTDYIFNGQGETPWKEDAPVEPINTYGRTKGEGEVYVRENPKHFILRISWVFGLNGNNFIKTMLRLAENHDTLTVVDDQTGSPTYTYDLARLAADMMETDLYGTYHVSNQGYCTWADFAKEIFRQAGKDVTVIPVTSEEYPSAAKRPHNSRMDQTRLIEAGFTPLPAWQDALSRYLSEIKAV